MPFKRTKYSKNKRNKNRYSRSKKKYRRKSRKRGGSADSITGGPESKTYGGLSASRMYVSGTEKGFTTCNSNKPCLWGVCEDKNCIYLGENELCLPFNNPNNRLSTSHRFNVTSIEHSTHGYPIVNQKNSDYQKNSDLREAANKKCLPGSYCGGVDRNYGFTCKKAQQQ